MVGRYISSPIDIERVMPSMSHGDWNHGEMSQDQFGVFRPFNEYPPYRTGVRERLSVWRIDASRRLDRGACGYNAATAIADDLGIETWWA